MGHAENGLIIIAIIQARMASSRLPGKVLVDIEGQAMLGRVVERARRARCLKQVVVATTTDSSDDAVASFCAKQGYQCFRGSPADVLDRFYQVACALQPDVIVRLTADCPVIDPDVIDEVVNRFLSDRECDFAANRLPPPWHRTYPIGLDVEVCTFQALERAWKEADQLHQREHVMPYLYEQEGQFKVLVVDHEPDYGFYRWTVDTPEDLEVLRQVYRHFHGRDDFSWLEVLDLFVRNPELSDLNAQVQHKHYREAESRHV